MKKYWVRLPDHTIEFINKYCDGINISEKIRYMLCSEILMKIVVKQNQILNQAKEEALQTPAFQNLIKQAEDYFKQSDEEILFLKDTNRILSDPTNKDKLSKRHQFYCKEYHHRITIQDFKLKLKEVEQLGSVKHNK